MREVRWERMFPDELERAIEDRPVVYFTYGLCEPHGPHNTVGLDGLKARAIAVATAREHGGIVAPPDYWHIHELGGYAIWAEKYVGEVERKWLTAVPPWVHFKNVVYHIRAAEQIGFKAGILITGHYGPNWEDLNTIVDLVKPFVRIQLASLPDFEANQPGFDNDGRSGGDHAGKVETSLLWALEPECVDMSRIPDRARDVRPDAPHHANDRSSGVRPVREALSNPPYFAMGADAPLADRTVGERMVADEVRWLGAKAAELMEAYPEDSQTPGLATFEDVERFWSDQVGPRFSEFRTMSRDFGIGGEVPPESVWFDTWEVPERT